MKRPTDRDKRVLDMCDRLVGLSHPERMALLDAVCANDPQLRQEIEELLNSIENSGEFMVLDTPESEM